MSAIAGDASMPCGHAGRAFQLSAASELRDFYLAQPKATINPLAPRTTHPSPPLFTHSLSPLSGTTIPNARALHYPRSLVPRWRRAGHSLVQDEVRAPSHFVFVLAARVPIHLHGPAVAPPPPRTSTEHREPPRPDEARRCPTRALNVPGEHISRWRGANRLPAQDELRAPSHFFVLLFGCTNSDSSTCPQLSFPCMLISTWRHRDASRGPTIQSCDAASARCSELNPRPSFSSSRVVAPAVSMARSRFECQNSRVSNASTLSPQRGIINRHRAAPDQHLAS